MTARIPASLARMARRPLVLALLSAALYVAAFYLPHGWALAFVALVPLIVAARAASSWRHAALMGYLVGGTGVGASVIWMLMVPAAFARPAFLAGAVVSWLLVVIVLGLAMAAWAALVRAAPHLSLPVILALSLAFAILEYLRMHAFNVLTYAPGIENPAFFSPGFLGYPLADGGAWLALAAWGGIYLMSLAAASANLAIAALALRRRPRAALASFAALALASLLPAHALLAPPPGGEPVRMGVISIHAPFENGKAGRGDAYVADLLRAIRELADDGAEVILLPEGAPSLPDLDIPEGVTIIGTLPAITPDDPTKGYLGAFSRAAGKDPEMIRAKRALTPQGEYTIALFRSVLSVAGHGGLVDAFRGRAGYSTGWDGDAAALPRGIRASVIFCIEMYYPGFGKALRAAQGSGIIAATLSHATFWYPPTLPKDTERALKVQAVESGAPVVASADFGEALVIDAVGRVIRKIGEGRASEWAAVDVIPSAPLSAR